MSSCIGLVGGLAVGASCAYYKRLAQLVESKGRPLDLVLVHADLATVSKHMTAKQPEALARYFADLIARLEAAGATFAAVPSVASHYGFAGLVERSPLPLVSILEAVRAEIEARRLRRVALFGSSFAMESDMYGALQHATDVVPLAASEAAAVNAIYMRLAHRGVSSSQDEQTILEIAHRVLAREQLDAVVLAGTDFAVMFDDHRPEFPYLDATDIHVGALAKRFLADAAL